MANGPCCLKISTSTFDSRCSISLHSFGSGGVRYGSVIARGSYLFLVPVRSIRSSELMLSLSSSFCDDLRALSDSSPLLTIASWNLLRIYYIEALRNPGSGYLEVSRSL